MRISLIVAMDRERGIGLENGLPWRLAADMKRFRELTMGHHLLLGRKTFESIGRPLPGRQIVIITRAPSYQVDGCSVVHSIEGALELARSRDETEVFIGGGAEVYAQALPLADRLYLTLVETVAPADTFFPKWESAEWIERERSFHPADDKNQFDCWFLVYENKNKPHQSHSSHQSHQ